MLVVRIMNRFLSVVVASIIAASPSHSQGSRAGIMNADLVGVWSMGNGYMWLYEDNDMKTLGPDCSLIGLGTWDFELGALTITVGGEEVIFTNILDVPTSPRAGDVMALDTTREWLFLGRDTEQEC